MNFRSMISAYITDIFNLEDKSPDKVVMLLMEILTLKVHQI